MDTKLPSAVYPMGKVDRDVPRVSSSGLHDAATQTGFGIGSTYSDDGALVLSLWDHYFGVLHDGILPHADRLSRWHGGPGNELLRDHLQEAFHAHTPVRAIVAKASDSAVVDAGADASKFKKECRICGGFMGRIVAFDGDRFEIHFRRTDVHSVRSSGEH